MTGQRKGVFVVFKQSGHFTADQLLKDAQSLDDTVSRATIYRCLPLLVESGVIRKIDVGHDNKFYALNGTSETFKAQVVCLDCDKIDIDAPFTEWYGKMFRKLGLDVKDQRLQVHAECPEFGNMATTPFRTNLHSCQPAKLILPYKSFDAKNPPHFPLNRKKSFDSSRKRMPFCSVTIIRLSPSSKSPTMLETLWD